MRAYRDWNKFLFRVRLHVRITVSIDLWLGKLLLLGILLHIHIGFFVNNYSSRRIEDHISRFICLCFLVFAVCLYFAILLFLLLCFCCCCCCCCFVLLYFLLIKSFRQTDHARRQTIANKTTSTKNKKEKKSSQEQHNWEECLVAYIYILIKFSGKHNVEKRTKREKKQAERRAGEKYGKNWLICDFCRLKQIYSNNNINKLYIRICLLEKNEGKFSFLLLICCGGVFYFIS